MTTEERVEKLEKELDKLQTTLATYIVTRELVITDEKGNVRASLGTNGSSLQLYDDNDKVIWSAP